MGCSGAGCGQAFTMGVHGYGCSEGRDAAPTGTGPGAGLVQAVGNCFLSPLTAVPGLLDLYQVAVF